MANRFSGRWGAWVGRTASSWRCEGDPITPVAPAGEGIFGRWHSHAGWRGPALAAITAGFLVSALTLVDSVLPGTASAQDVPPQTSNIPADSFLPQPGQKTTFADAYADGDSATVEAVTAQLDNGALVSTAELVWQEGELVTGSVIHYVGRGGAVYEIQDVRPDEPMLWLKGNLSQGQRYQATGIAYTIVDTNATLDLGFAEVHNCLVVEKNLSGVGFVLRSYYAPGMGVLLVKDARTGFEFRRAIGFEGLEPSAAAEMVWKFAPNGATIAR